MGLSVLRRAASTDARYNRVERTTFVPIARGSAAEKRMVGIVTVKAKGSTATITPQVQKNHVVLAAHQEVAKLALAFVVAARAGSVTVKAEYIAATTRLPAKNHAALAAHQEVAKHALAIVV